MQPAGNWRSWDFNQPGELKRLPAKNRDTRKRPVGSCSCNSRIERLGLRGLVKLLLRRTVATIVAVEPGSREAIRTRLA